MRKRIIGLAVSAGVLVAAFPAAASAATTGSGSRGAGGTGGWTPVTYTARAYAAGNVCSFELKEEFPTQGVEERIVATYSDGTPLRTDFRGPLIAHFTNVTTGAQVDEDLSGVGTLYNFPDKSSLWNVPDNVGLTVHAGDPYHAQGEYVLAGQSVIAISPTGQIAVLYQTRVIDVCAALS
jgi:hypothetical protein